MFVLLSPSNSIIKVSAFCLSSCNSPVVDVALFLVLTCVNNCAPLSFTSCYLSLLWMATTTFSTSVHIALDFNIQHVVTSNAALYTANLGQYSKMCSASSAIFGTFRAIRWNIILNPLRWMDMLENLRVRSKKWFGQNLPHGGVARSLYEYPIVFCGSSGLLLTCSASPAIPRHTFKLPLMDRGFSGEICREVVILLSPEYQSGSFLQSHRLLVCILFCRRYIFGVHICDMQLQSFS